MNLKTEKKQYVTGIQSREKLLDAASRVFSEYGYYNTRVTDICRLAGTNAAAVNYHFGGKDGLYKATWYWVFEPDNWSLLKLNEGTAEERLSKFVRAFIENYFDEGILGRFSRIYLMEILNPTNLLHTDWQKLILPTREALDSIVKQIAGVTEEPLRSMCVMSIIMQCRGFYIYSIPSLQEELRRETTPDMIECLIEHVTNFIIAGLRDIKARCTNVT